MGCPFTRLRSTDLKHRNVLSFEYLNYLKKGKLNLLQSVESCHQHKEAFYFSELLPLCNSHQ